MDIDNILAKSTKNGGTILTQHLLNVGCIYKLNMKYNLRPS
jgi:hypothetical protein